MSEWPDTDHCLWCDERLDTDGVSFVPMHTPVGVRFEHVECAIRRVVGGINHQNRQCSCCGGSLPPDPQGVSRRIAAQMAAQMWKARNP